MVDGEQVWYWLSENFVLGAGSGSTQGSVSLFFKHLGQTPTTLWLGCSPEGVFLVSSDRLELCAEVIQNLAAFFRLVQMAATIEMADEPLRCLTDLMRQIRELQSIRQRLTADMADQVRRGCVWNKCPTRAGKGDGKQAPRLTLCETGLRNEES